MGVGLYLTGRWRTTRDDPEAWLGRVQSWLEEHAGEPLESVRLGRDGEDHPAVLVNLHPCAEDFEIVVPEAGRVAASAKTSTVGPGYHAFLCDLLHRLGEAMDIDWDAPEDESGTGDETGYFHTGDPGALEGEFLEWLSGVAKLVAEGLEQDCQWMMISMAIGHHYHHHGPLVTPMGPRDVRWLEAVAEDPIRGIDLFPWWPAGIGAPFYLGRALARMWRDVRWRAPLADDEGRLLMDVHLDLVRAYRLDSSLDYPWREWRELMESIEAHFGYVEMAGDDLEAEVRRRAAEIGPEASVPLIGYRRRPVRVDLTDGWSIEVPGEMAEEWDEEGLWTARDAGRAVFFKSYSLSKDDGSQPEAREILDGLTLPDGRRLEHQNEGVIGRAALTSPDGDDETGWQLIGHNAIDGGLAACNIMFGDPDEREWAIATWRSLGHS
jgi:hypothetical protein